MANPVLERLPQLRRITNTPVFRRGLTVARQHSLVCEPLRFAIGEIRGDMRAHSLAASPEHAVVVRHGTGDMGILDEIFRPPQVYAPPPDAAQVLCKIVGERSLRVLDLGANIGLFAVHAVSSYPGAEVTSYEPEPDNLAVLLRCASRNRTAKWTVVHACALATDETVRITPGQQGHSCVSDVGVEVAGVDVLPLLGQFDFVKMDTEGSEWPIIQDARWPDAMASVSVLALEWHKRGCSSDDARSAAQVAVDAAGFESSPSPAGWDHGMIWGWR